MTALIWDKPGERTFESGIDRGVLYLLDGRVVPWNGLTNIEDSSNKQISEFYYDGIKYLEYNTPGDFLANLKAFTYPEEFNEVNGVISYVPGLRVHNQSSKHFCLSYRTKIGDDIDGIDAGYIIHLIYNVLATPDSSEYTTLGSELKPTEFSWSLSSRPVRSSLWRPSAHLSIDSRKILTDRLDEFESVIYGTDSVDPVFPTIDDIIDLLVP